jgi:putative flippase GtrA
MTSRGFKFIVVGAAGFAVQLGALAVLTAFHVHWMMATIAAVECAIVHNYWWHERWTWRDRGRGFALARLARFHTSAAVTSIGGNVAAMAVLVGVAGLHPVPANAIAVAILSVANFLIADRWVFSERRRAAAAVVALALPATASAAPPAEALNAWQRAVVEVERSIDRVGVTARPAGIVAEGDSDGVSGGTLSRWRGSVFVPSITLDRFLQRLQHPGTPPPQDDVVAARVLGRGPDSLRIYMRLVRRAIVTVAYDTEHDMSFTRRSPTWAVARSEATRIEEVGSGDKGLLWRLNSYWRYDETADGVLVQVETLTLSRDVPLLVRPIAGPIVRRVARESMVRTLAALRDYMQGA